jgi:hypothetical protein
LSIQLALAYLGTARIDTARRIKGSREGVVVPLVRLGRDDIRMRVQQKRRQRALRPRPLDKHQRLTGDQLESLRFKPDGFSLRGDKGSGFGVVRERLRRVYAEVLLKARHGGCGLGGGEAAGFHGGERRGQKEKGEMR